MLRFFVLIVFCELEIAAYVASRFQGQFEFVVLFAEGELHGYLGAFHDRRSIAAILAALVGQIEALPTVHIGMRDPAVVEGDRAVVKRSVVLVVNIAFLAGESVVHK